MHARLHNIALAAAVASSVAAVAAGCGSNNNDNSSNTQTQTKEKTTAQAPASTTAKGKGGTLALAADPSGQLAFDKKSLAAKSGKVTIDFSNSAPLAHALAVEGNGVDKKTKTFQGGKAVLTVDLKPGKYEFYCPVPGHKQAGMKGELTVQ